MNKAGLVLFIIIGVTSIICFQTFAEQEEANMKVLKIKWQRLVDEKGKTCSRCGATEKEVQKAFQSLKQSLAPLGIKVILEEKALDSAICAKDISQSNRIWISGRPLEEWLGAQVSKSPCEFCCADAGKEVECRTVEVNRQVYEAIPSDLIIQAGLLAASELIKKDTSGSGKTKSKEKPCCP